MPTQMTIHEECRYMFTEEVNLSKVRHILWVWNLVEVFEFALLQFHCWTIALGMSLHVY